MKLRKNVVFFVFFVFLFFTCQIVTGQESINQFKSNEISLEVSGFGKEDAKVFQNNIDGLRIVLVENLFKFEKLDWMPQSVKVFYNNHQGYVRLIIPFNAEGKELEGSKIDTRGFIALFFSAQEYLKKVSAEVVNLSIANDLKNFKIQVYLEKPNGDKLVATSTAIKNEKDFFTLENFYLSLSQGRVFEYDKRNLNVQLFGSFLEGKPQDVFGKTTPFYYLSNFFQKETDNVPKIFKNLPPENNKKYKKVTIDQLFYDPVTYNENWVTLEIYYHGLKVPQNPPVNLISGQVEIIYKTSVVNPSQYISEKILMYAPSDRNQLNTISDLPKGKKLIIYGQFIQLFGESFNVILVDHFSVEN